MWRSFDILGDTKKREDDPEDTFYMKVETNFLHCCNKMTTPLHLLAYALS